MISFSAMHWSEADADALSIWYDVGGIIAAIIAGAISVIWNLPF